MTLSGMNKKRANADKREQNIEANAHSKILEHKHLLLFV
jgi:hypothetical protein